MNQSLAYNHPVKWIFMIIGKLRQMAGSVFLKCKTFNFMQIPLVRYKFFGCFRQRQASQ